MRLERNSKSITGDIMSSTLHPFDIKTVLLAKHAQHVVLIHFPIALFIVGVGFDLVAQRTKSLPIACVARYNLIAAAVFIPPVLISGLLAWKWALGAPPLKGILLLHLVIACTASVLTCVAGWLQFTGMRRIGKPLPVYRLPIEVIAAALIALTAHLGGFVSGVNIPG
jgi:uncharacterized membrane protein